MPSTRRRVLLGTAGALAALAGCNDTSNDDWSTVTPVDVPRTKGEVLQQAADIESPEIPPAVRVTDDHLAAAIEDTEALVTDLRSAIDRSEDVDLGELRRRVSGEPEDVIETAESRLESARETGPSQDALSTVMDAVRDVSLTLGFIEAKLGDVDAESLDAEFEAERTATEALADRFSYRVARPLGAYLPTLLEAERNRPDLATLENSRRPLANLDEGREDVEMALALARQELESHRRNRRNAAQLLSTATDETAPSVRPAIEAALSDHREEVEAIADTYADREPPNNATVEGEIRNIRIHVGSRSRRWLSRLDEFDGSAPLSLLLDMTEWLIEFSALDAAVTRTVDALEGDEIANDAILTAKRDAVESLETVAAGNALQRSFATRSALLLRTADRNTRGDDPRTVARTHLLYSAVGEWGTRSLERADSVIASLQAQQS